MMGTDTDEREIELMLDEAHSEGRPWYRQAWFTKIVAPLAVLGIAGVVSTFFVLRADVWAAKRRAERAKSLAEENEGRLETMRENRRDFERQVIKKLSDVENGLESNTQSLDQLRGDVREHRESHH